MSNNPTPTGQRPRYLNPSYLRQRSLPQDLYAAGQYSRYLQYKGASYWEDPARITRYVRVAQSLPPGAQSPDWLPRQELELAYDYLNAKNQGRPWWSWQIEEDDPIRPMLQQLPTPPQEALWPSEQRYAPAPQEQLPNPAQGGMSEEQFRQLPGWQQTAISALSSPETAGTAMGALAGAQGGPLGALFGAGLGRGLGALGEKYPWLVGMLNVLDAGAEGIERMAGITAQAVGAIQDPEKYGSLREVLSDLPAAWRAAHLTYETGTGLSEVGGLPFLGGQSPITMDVGNIATIAESVLTGKPLGELATRGQVWQLGQAQPVTPEVGTDLTALVAARRRLAAGESPEDVWGDISQQMGTSGMAWDAFGHMLLDPLNFTEIISGKALTTLGKLAGNADLVRAAQVAGSPTEALQMYGTLLRTQKPVEEISRMGAVSRWLAGVTKAGEVKALRAPTELTKIGKLAGATALGLPGAVIGYGVGGPVGALIGGVGGAYIGGKSGWNYLTQLTPQARATEVVNNSAVELALVLERAGDDPATLVKYVRGLANTPHDLARELSMASIDSPEGAAIPMFLRDNVKVADDLLTQYQATRWQATLVDNISSVTGKTPEDVLKELGNVKDADVLLRQYVDAARQRGGDQATEIVRAFDAKELTPDKLKSVVQSFVEAGIPRTPDEFRGQLYASLMQRADDWAAKYFNVKPDPAWARLGQTVKSAQSLVLLGLNPTYFINNALNNAVTMAASGVFGFKSPTTIAQVWDRVGVTPPRLKAGVGPASLGVDLNYQAIREAATAPGTMTDIQRFFTRAGDKLGIFSNLSGKVEQLSSAQAMTSGFTQAWSRLWRPGAGFDRLPRPLEQALRQVNPDLPNVIYAAIQGGMNQKEVEAALWSGVGQLSLERSITPIAEQLKNAGVNLGEADVREMLQGVGIYDYLNDQLKTAKSPEEVRKVFTEVDKKVNSWLDQQAADAARAKATEVAARVRSEGFAGVVQLWDEVQLKTAETWHRHFIEWENTFAQIDANPARKKALIQAQRAASRAEWDRAWKYQEGGLLGIFEGLGFEDPKARDISSYFVKQADSWREFFRLRDEKYDAFFNTVFTNKARRDAVWNDLQLELMQLYNTHATEEVRLQGLLDARFVEAFAEQFGNDVASKAAAWRDVMKQFYQERAGLMSRHRTAIAVMPHDERQLAWTQFLNTEYMPFLRDFFQSQINGAHSLYGRGGEPQIPEMRMPGGQPPPAPPTPAIPNISQVRSVAQRFGIASADVGGRPVPGADIHILNAIKKYGGPEAAGYKSLDDVDPAIAERAFVARQAAQQAPPTTEQPEPELGNLPSSAEVSEVERAATAQREALLRRQGEITGDLQVEPNELPQTTPDALGAINATQGMQSTPPLGEIAEEGWQNYVRPILQAMQDYLVRPEVREPEIKDLRTALDPDTLRGLRAYMGQVYGQMSDTKLASIKWGENRRDAALLNYSRRYGLDNVLNMFFPYQFWYTRSAMQWALRAIDRPTWLANWARLRSMQQRVVQAPGFPARLQGKMRIPIPFLPEWAGGGVYVDPMRQIFPFEQLMKPFQRYAQEQSHLTSRAEYIVAQMQEDGEIDEGQAQQVLTSRSGPVWEKALTQARMEVESEINNPFDFMNVMLGSSLPVQWAYYLSKGQSDRIGVLPVTRMINSVTALAGLNQGRGVNIEAGIRGQLGLPEYDRFSDYRVDRMLATMAADGTVTTEEAQQAMIDRTGSAFMEAQRRVAQSSAWSFVGSAISADVFPEGEQEQRALKEEYGKALYAWQAGDKEALTKFFDTYPEYEARLMTYREPEDRLKRFLISEVWDAYHKLPELYQRQMREQLGDTFEQAFLEKETRSYDSIDSKTLALWAKLMGGNVPGAAGDLPQVDLNLASPEVAASYQAYQNEKDKLFPGLSRVYDLYFSLPEGPARDRFAASHPELDQYNQWRDQYLAGHPEIIEYSIGPENRLYGAPRDVQVLTYQYRSELSKAFPGIYDIQDEYFSLDRNQKRAYLNEHPELPAYWEWRREFMRQYPQTIPYLYSEEALAEKVLGEPVSSQNYQAPPSLPWIRYFTPALTRQLTGYYSVGQPLGVGAMKELARIWEKTGRPGKDFQNWIRDDVRVSVGQ